MSVGTLRQGRSRPRPIRVAFLVQENEHAHLAFDGIFADCYRRWGGRYSLIVPCVENRIQEAFWPWLKAFDPDVVYSYVSLSEEDVLDLHERLNPSVYERHKHYREPRLDVFGFSPAYGAAPLSSLSTIFRLARHRRPDGAGGRLSIIDSWFTETPSRFLTDNFGTYHWSYGTSVYPQDAKQAAGLLTIVSPDKEQDRKFGIPSDLTTIPDELAAFQAFTERRVTSLSMASLYFAPQLDIRGHRWGGSFNLVIGDSYADRLLFWNARLLIPGWLRGDLCCLSVSQEQLQDDDFFDALVAFINRHNHVNEGSGGHSNLTLRSTSVPAGDLDEIAKRLRKARCWSMVRTQFVASLDELIPSAADLEHASFGHGLGGILETRPDWTDFSWEFPNIRPPSSIPDHLLDAPPRQHFTTGAWATDHILEHEEPKPRFSDTNYWLLPRAWRMGGAFAATFSSASRDLVYPVRSTKEGYLTLFESIDRTIHSLTVPSAYEAMHHALCRDGQWVRMAGYKGPTVPQSRAIWMSPSNEARYLNGILGMAGGLSEARRFLLHPFMTEIFARLGGTPNLPVDKVAPTVARLRKLRPRISAFDLADGQEQHALGMLIVKAAQNLKSPRTFVKYSSLSEAWTQHREAFWQRHGLKPEDDPRIDWEAHEQQSLDECLIALRRRQMFFQGHQWVCPECHHRNWVDLIELKPMLTCAICRHEEEAPITFEWLFRPNEFLIEGLRDHSVLSLVWVLTALSNEARQSFLYAGPSWFHFEDAEAGPDAEADLLAVCDGIAILCEAKSSWASLRTRDLDDLVALAKRLRPDVALLAIMETGENLAPKISEAKQTLADEGIELRLMTLATHPIEDDPYLH